MPHKNIPALSCNDSSLPRECLRQFATDSPSLPPRDIALASTLIPQIAESILETQARGEKSGNPIIDISIRFSDGSCALWTISHLVPRYRGCAPISPSVAGKRELAARNPLLATKKTPSISLSLSLEFSARSSSTVVLAQLRNVVN